MLWIKNWESFQHYRRRRPPWIKLHRSILDDADFMCLPDASRALAPCLWLLASEENGCVPGPLGSIAWRLRMSEEHFIKAMTPLVLGGFVIDADGLLMAPASVALAERKQSATPETETETETETEERQSGDASVALASRRRDEEPRAPDPPEEVAREVSQPGEEQQRPNGSGLAVAAEEVWGATLDAIAAQVSPQSFATWFRPSVGLRLEGGRLTIGVPTPQFRDWIQANYQTILSDALPPEVSEVQLVVAADPSEPPPELMAHYLRLHVPEPDARARALEAAPDFLAAYERLQAEQPKWPEPRLKAMALRAIMAKIQA